jgi:arabinogalactan oligomer/maltooligosaccharide transport system substrate-binding protein
MKKKWFAAGLILIVGVLLFVSCGGTGARGNSEALGGRILLWHASDETETAALTQVIDSFINLNPNVTIRVQNFPSQAALKTQFLIASASGMQADLLLGPATWLDELASAASIRPIDLYLPAGVVNRYSPAILNIVQRDGETYALPQTLDTLAIYVNTSLVEQPVKSLNGLLGEANAGIDILIPINFYDAFWGIRAFGGRVLDEEGRAILDQGGFANWLAWLRDSRTAPGMIQDSNHDVLFQRFLTGSAGYYFGYASELNDIIAALGQESVLVQPLPNEPVGQAGPFVSTKGIYFGAASSNTQRRLAVELATFMTNSEQSARLMRLANFVPANADVRINPRLNPLVAAFTVQARNGVPVPFDPNFPTLLAAGNEAYVRVLEGGEAPVDVAFALNNTINEINGFDTQDAPSFACSSLGTLVVAVSLMQPNDLDALDQVIEQYRAVCPLIIIDTVTLQENEDVAAELGTLRQFGLPPASALLTQRDLRNLATGAPWLRKIDSEVTPQTLQKFWPVALDAMRIDGALYGLPLAVDVNALYYNRALVAAPAQSLDELRTQAVSSPVVLDVRVDRAFWGVGAFGGQVFDRNRRAILDQGGLAEWLNWLVESRDLYNIELSIDGEDLRRRFTGGEIVYYIGGPQDLPEFTEALGDDLGVALLPTGPGGPARPLVRSSGMTFRADADATTFDLAMEFVRYATDAEAQRTILATSSRLPANATLSFDDAPNMLVFAQQAQLGWPAPNTSDWQTVLDFVPQAIEAVIEEGRDPVEVVAETTAAINTANGIAPLPPATPSPEAESPDAPSEETPEEALETTPDSISDTLREGADTPVATPATQP